MVYLGRTPASRGDTSLMCLADTTENELWTHWGQVVGAAQLWIRLSTVAFRLLGSPSRYSRLEISQKMHSYYALIMNDLLLVIFKYFMDMYIRKFMPS